MRTIFGFMVVSAIVAVLIVGAVIQLLIQLIPYLILAAGIVVAVHALRRRSTPPVPYRPALPPPQPRHRTHPRRVGPPPGAWVFVPVWVAPPPRRPDPSVIDAEIIEDDRRG
jgi:hypothetical protein